MKHVRKPRSVFGCIAAMLIAGAACKETVFPSESSSSDTVSKGTELGDTGNMTEETDSLPDTNTDDVVEPGQSDQDSNSDDTDTEDFTDSQQDDSEPQNSDSVDSDVVVPSGSETQDEDSLSESYSEIPTAQLNDYDQMVDEGSGTVVAVVRLSHPSDVDVHIPFTVSSFGLDDPDDYSVSDAPLVIPAGSNDFLDVFEDDPCAASVDYYIPPNADLSIEGGLGGASYFIGEGASLNLDTGAGGCRFYISPGASLIYTGGGGSHIFYVAGTGHISVQGGGGSHKAYYETGAVITGVTDRVEVDDLAEVSSDDFGTCVTLLTEKTTLITPPSERRQYRPHKDGPNSPTNLDDQGRLIPNLYITT